MQLEQRINAFVTLGQFLGQFTSNESVKNINILHNEVFYDKMLMQLELAKNHNGWFTSDNLFFACKSWSEVLSNENIKQWVKKYNLAEIKPKVIGIIMAGNIPLVGLHDFLSVLITGNKVLVKLSTKDKQLLPFLANYLVNVEPDFEELIEFTEGKLINFDAIIATGSNNTARYFDYYFGKYPHIIRKNRNSLAILTGNETPQQMAALSDDIFRYFGLGCRNVSKIFIPKDYDMDLFFNGIFSWKNIINCNKYINNYDYNKAVYLMSNFALLDNEFLLLKEDTGYSSPISVVFYEVYSDISTIKYRIETDNEFIQCVVSQAGIENEIAFGTTQYPNLWDYADGVDTIEFLLKLS